MSFVAYEIRNLIIANALMSPFSKGIIVKKMIFYCSPRVMLGSPGISKTLSDETFPAKMPCCDNYSMFYP
jgi:hypothetical protein